MCYDLCFHIYIYNVDTRLPFRYRGKLTNVLNFSDYAFFFCAVYFRPSFTSIDFNLVK